MTNRSILLITVFIIATVYSAKANYLEGQYIDNAVIVRDEIVADRSYQVIGNKNLESIFLPNAPFKDICLQLNLSEKLSICMKVLQHKYKVLKPTSFTANPTESNFMCRPYWFYGKHKLIYRHRMYDCPIATVKFMNEAGQELQFIERPFSIGQGLHETQFRVHSFDCTSNNGPAEVLSQLTGFKLDKVHFSKTQNKHYLYRPNYKDSDTSGSDGEIIQFRPDGDNNDYMLDWKNVK